MEDVELYRYFNNEATPEEVLRIERWLEEDIARRKEFDAAHMLFNAMMLRGGAANVRGRGRLVRLGRAAMRIAAAVVLIVGAGYAGGRIETEALARRMSETMQVVEVPAGQRMELTLADGTRVCLNGDSRIEYPLLFAKERRRVKLSGEAFFKVAHDAAHPFAVETFASEVEVLGTEFNVLADDDCNRFATTLVEGRVRVRCPGGGMQPVELNPGEMVRLADGKLSLSKVDREAAICWTEGYIDVSGVSFDELMRRFERAYGVGIRLERTDLPQIAYASGKVRVSEGVDFALRLLQLACDFTYTRDEETNTIIIR